MKSLLGTSGSEFRWKRPRKTASNGLQEPLASSSSHFGLKKWTFWHKIGHFGQKYWTFWHKIGHFGPKNWTFRPKNWTFWPKISKFSRKIAKSPLIAKNSQKFSQKAGFLVHSVNKPKSGCIFSLIKKSPNRKMSLTKKILNLI